MYCPNCKKTCPEGTRYCSTCGGPLTEGPEKKKKPASFGKGLVTGLLIMALVVGCAAAVLFIPRMTAGSSKAPRPGYETPEDAAVAYFEAFQKGDVDGAISTFALQEYTDCYDLYADYSKDLSIYDANPLRNSFPILLNDNEFTRSLNIEARRLIIGHMLQKTYRNIIFPDWKEYSIERSRKEAFPDTIDSPEEYYDHFKIEDVDNKLENMTIKKIYTCEELFEKDDKLKRQWELTKEDVLSFTDAEDLTYLQVKYTVGGRTCTQELSQICIDGRWYNFFPAGPYSHFTELR